VPRPSRRVALATVTVLFLFAVATLGVAQPLLPSPHTGFNQAYRLGDGAWGDCPLGTEGCPDRLSVTGCLVCAMSAILDYYGMELEVSAADSCSGRARRGMDPGILNDWLRANDGFGSCASDPSGQCCLSWSTLPGVEVIFYENAREEGIDFLSEARIDEALEAGYPVVAGVHWADSCGGGRGSEDCHWVVITGRRGTTYAIIDPFNPEMSSRYGVRTTLDAGVLGRYTVDRFAVVVGPLGQVAVPTVEIAAVPLRRSGQIALEVAVDGVRAPLASFVRLTSPDGSRRFVIRPSGGVPITAGYTVPQRTVFHDAPVSFPSGTQEWLRLRTDGLEEGTWRWEVWLEDPLHPGSVVASDRASFTIGEEEVTVAQSLAALGVILVVIGLAFVLSLSQE
jgi:hypothetical protein